MYPAGKRSELFHGEHAVLDELSYASVVLVNFLIVLERPASFWVEALQTLFALLIYMFPGLKSLKEEKNRKSWYLIVNHGVLSLTEENCGAGAKRYSFIHEIFLKHM